MQSTAALVDYLLAKQIKYSSLGRQPARQGVVSQLAEMTPIVVQGFVTLVDIESHAGQDSSPQGCHLLSHGGPFHCTTTALI